MINIFEKVSYEQFEYSIIKYLLSSNVNACSVQDELRYSNDKDASLNKDLIKEIYDDIKLPQRSTRYSVGYDFFSPFNIKFPHCSTKKIIIPTGIKCNLPSLLDMMDKPNIYPFLALYPRSSYGINYGFKIQNTVGIIDCDYYNNTDNEGHILLAFSVESDNFEMKRKNKMCQGIIQYAITTDTVDELRTSGIGSTGM